MAGGNNPPCVACAFMRGRGEPLQLPRADRYEVPDWALRKNGVAAESRGASVDSDITHHRRFLEVSDILLRPYIKAQTAITALREREEGQTITEYALIIASIAILLIVAMLFLAGKINVLFHNTGNSVENPGQLP